ncbi:magnesium-translocating P-type ATPase [Actinomadura napierensis]|uniref:magnesium-translocating P-type ATPase n=1 Tax=Actinomadura napierensis TaxID=267854 RepID=UPI0031D94D44
MFGRLVSCAEQPSLTVLRTLESSPRGLDEREAQDRLLRYGEGGTARPGVRSRRVLRVAAAPFVLVLLLLSIVTALAGDLRGAALVCALAVVSGALRLHQERRSDRAAAALRTTATMTATVVRRAGPSAEPVAREVPVEQVVPGDIVQLHPGDVVPADLRLLSSSDLRIDQAVLSGESFPAGKHATWTAPPEPPEPGSDLFGHPRVCFMGTTVVSGSGRAVAVATGSDTCFGATSRDLASGRLETAFERGVRAVSWALVGVTLAALPVVVTVTGVLRGDWAQALLLAIAVAVAATPEMLPLVVTALLARGVRGLARRDVIVKRLAAVHNLGAMDTLCLDKTGTLTEERVSLVCHLDPAGRPDPEVLRWARANALWSVELAGHLIGDPIDEALLQDDADDSASAEWAGVDAIPFDFTRRRATVLLRRDRPAPGGAPSGVLVTKGSVEEVLASCDRVRTGDGERLLEAAERRRLLELGDQWAGDGVRLLAVATAERDLAGRPLGPADEERLTFLGFVGFRDLLEPAVVPAVRALQRGGLRLVMITGDHPLVARRICRDAGIPASRVVLGHELAGLDDGAVAGLAASGAAFARIGPPQKARIVRALKGAGRTVGYLGDGVNDAPALRAADVGISISDAPDLVRASSDVILVRKDLRVLEQAVLAGRRTFANTAKYIKIALTSNFGNVVSMLAAGVMLPFLPMLPLQILVQNICFDLSQLALVYDRVDDSEIRAPRTFDRSDLARFVACLGALFDLTAFGLFWWVLHAHGGAAGQALFHSGWFAENLVAQGLTMALLRGRGRGAPRPAAAVLAAAGALGLAGLLLPFSPVAGLLGLAPLPVAAFPLLAAVMVAYALATVVVRRVYQNVTGRWL